MGLITFDGQFSCSAYVYIYMSHPPRGGSLYSDAQSRQFPPLFAKKKITQLDRLYSRKFIQHFFPNYYYIFVVLLAHHISKEHTYVDHFKPLHVFKLYCKKKK